SIGGSANFTARSRQAGRIRSRQSRNAVGSPSSASSTALRVKASAPPASRAAAASVVLLQEPTRRPAGLPDFPFSNGRPRTRPGGFGEAPSAIDISFCRRRSPAPRCEGLCDANKAILWSYIATNTIPGTGSDLTAPSFHPSEGACEKNREG